MTFTDLTAQSSDPSLYLLKIPIQGLASVQALAGFVSNQVAIDDPNSVLVQIVPNSAADLFIRG